VTDKQNPLEGLYPFLHQKKKNPSKQKQALLLSIQQKVAASINIKALFFEQNQNKLIAAAETLAACYKKGGKLLSMGNGGSSCDANHVAVEFQHPVTAGRPSLPAFNMNNDNAFFSAVANDVGTKYVFSRQIEAHGNSNDCLIGFTTSGNSDNLFQGFKKAKQMEIASIVFSGGDGGDIATNDLVDHCLVVNTDSIHRVQEVHVICYHILWDLTHTLLADYRGFLAKDN